MFGGKCLILGLNDYSYSELKQLITSRSVSRMVVTRGCWLKFSQNKKLLYKLDRTGKTLIVDCAPWDRVWGIGLRLGDPNACNPDRYKWCCDFKILIID